MVSVKERAIRNTILKKRLQGLSDSKIRKELVGKKNFPFMVDRALLETSRSGGKRKYLIVGVILLIVIVLISLLLLVPNVLSTTCESDSCFISRANRCSTVDMNREIEGGKYSFSAQNCVLTKTLVSLPDDEFSSVKELLEGESMTCQYSSGNFDSDLISTVSLGIQNCEGLLKDDLELLIDAL